MGNERLTIDGERSNRTVTLAAEFGRMITAGHLLSGETLPIEKDIQTSRGVSRTVVREAMRHLAAKGLVSVGPKVGTRVRPRTEWNMLDADVMAWHLTAPVRRPFIEALYEMRLINEPAAARLASRRIDTQKAGRLTAALSGMRDNPRGSPELIAADLDFHRIVLEATGNPLLISLGALIERSLSVSFSLSWRQNPQDETVRQHERVMQAILAGDGEAAELFMRRLIESAFDDVIHALYANGEGEARSGELPDGRRAVEPRQTGVA
ncbi:FadR/GntR family transcriptional regulator [Jiella sonneratiae]|uniref:FadR family transcriptional regulator n=1 Tax=Jiella sonneratiae TaxID=2816856 RepID=A0ABS3J0C9_9HYPH|nr:FadR/GntR family transcriptional regulator [Jiella sonneratiae]MBO0903111.1 FadR family transcriptional regulator [Jiella sonneratiae]